MERGRLRDARRARGLRGRGAGCARPLSLRRRLRSLSAGRQGRLRQHRVARAAALERRPGGPDRALLPGGGAVAGGGRAAAAAQGDGAVDDVFDRSSLLLLRRGARPLVAALVLQGDRPRRQAPAGPARPEDRGGGGPGLGREPGGLAPIPAARHASGARRCRARLFRVARPPRRRAVLGLPAGRQPLRPRPPPGAEPLRLARRGLRPGQRRTQFRGHAPVGRSSRDRAVDPRNAHAAKDPHRRAGLRQRRRARLRGTAAALLRPLAQGRGQRARPRGPGPDLRHGRQRLA